MTDAPHLGDTRPFHELVTEQHPLPWRNEGVPQARFIYDAQDRLVALIPSFRVAEWFMRMAHDDCQ